MNKLKILLKRELRVWNGKLERWQRKWRAIDAPRREVQMELPLH